MFQIYAILDMSLNKAMFSLDGKLAYFWRTDFRDEVEKRKGKDEASFKTKREAISSAKSVGFANRSTNSKKKKKQSVWFDIFSPPIRSLRVYGSCAVLVILREPVLALLHLS